MRFYYFLLILGFITVTTPSFAQQLDNPTLYKYNWQTLNPASMDYIYLQNKQKRSIINIAGRTQWLGSDFPDSPNFLQVRYERNPRIYAGDVGLKLGGFAAISSAGPIESMQAQFTLASVVKLDKKSIISVGMNTGLIQNRINTDEIFFRDYSVITKDVFTSRALELGVGVFYVFNSFDENCNCENVVNSVYAGLSIPRIGHISRLDKDTTQPYLRLVPHIYLILGATTPIRGDGSYLEVSTWVKRVGNSSFQTLGFNNDETTYLSLPLSADLNFRLQYRTKAWLGAGYSTSKMIHTEAGFQLGDKKSGSSDLFLAKVSFGASFPTAWNSLLGPAAEVSISMGL